jgi:formylglycine-generating enzyme required for sulfatase activity
MDAWPAHESVSSYLIDFSVAGRASVSRIFVSHSSSNNAEAVALRSWLEREGWQGEIFLDLDPDDGIAAGERWERSLHEAANRCEAVLFLISKAWIASRWCRRELGLAQRLNKRLFGVLIEDLATADVPEDLSGDWQLVRLATGRDHVLLSAVLPVTHKEVHVTFSAEGLRRLKHGLELAGLDPRRFVWPPADDPNRPPYRGLKPLESEDAGIFFGRDAPIVKALDRLRGMREETPPRLIVILGASGSGKSSFLRAGLLPRIARDDRNFVPLPIIRPERAVISSETGLLRALESAFQAYGIPVSRALLRAKIEDGAPTLGPILQMLVDKATVSTTPGDTKPRPPTLVLSIDQGEELFLAEGQGEARSFLALLQAMLVNDAPSIAALITIRSDAYELLQVAGTLEGVHQETFSLPPMPKGSYADVIKDPARRLDGTTRPLKVEDGLVDKLLSDIDAGDGKDALPLLAFTLERLYIEHGGDGDLKLAEYQTLGGIRGSIEAAVERAFRAADANPKITPDPAARLALLRRGLIPWLAGIDPDTGVPRRRVAKLSEIPPEARPLIQCFVDQRLLTTDRAVGSGEITIEPAHEVLLRQWSLSQKWLAEDAARLGVLESVKRASREWEANGRNSAWLTHSTSRLDSAERLRERPDIAANLEPIDWKYLAACRANEKMTEGRKRRMTFLASALCVVSLWLLPYAATYVHQRVRLLPILWNVSPTPLTTAGEAALKPKDTFKECSNCPQMVVVPAGGFTMGSPENEPGRNSDESPAHMVSIAKSFAITEFEITFDEWDACVAHGGCSQQPKDQGWGRGTRPVINVNWTDVQEYAAWLSKLTGKTYRLLSEAEWEYATRAGSTTAYYWGDQIDTGKADCIGCGSQWDAKQTAPVGSFSANAFGLYDMAGNVWEWIEDCYQDSYSGAPVDGSARTDGDCSRRVVRGGSWGDGPENLRSAVRNWDASIVRGYDLGFRLVRSLTP